VLKGHFTVITDGSSVKVNKAGSSALATMGTGDVLDGMIAAYAAVHGNAFESAVAAVTAHSMLGDALWRKKGNHIIAMDLIDALPSFLRKFDKTAD
jgi:NAD(P)H-hydrate epimerase